jgi:DNA segregation ATPase FtsK/SpoIIIE-like protein
LTSEARAEPWFIDECAVLAWVLKRNGITPSSIELAHIDASFPYRDAEDNRLFCRMEKLDDAVRPLVDEVPDWILAIRRILAGEEPGIDQGLSCRDPETCPAESCGRRPSLDRTVFPRFLQGSSLRYFLPDLSSDENASAIMPDNSNEQAPYFFEAVAILQRHCRDNKIALIEQPVSLLQRRLRLGYRATLRLVDELERRGILSPKLNPPPEGDVNPD